MKKKRVLIFPAGTEIAFEILNALKYSKFVELYGGTSVDDHSEFVYERLIKGFPYVDDEKFVCYLNEVIEQYDIEYIYPAHDDASLYLSKYAENINATIISAEYETVRICRSKSSTYEHFKGEKFIPKTYNSIGEIKSYPVFLKPDIGQGSVGTKKINSYDELKEYINNNKSLVICEYLPGMEYTVDCFTDRFGRLRVVKLRNRERIKAGISVRSKLLEVDDKVLEIAKALNSKLDFRGAWFFQLKKNDNNEYRLMETSARIPGTMGVSRNLGINFPLLTLFDFWEYDVDIIDNNYNIVLDRAFYNSYKIQLDYDYVYVDYDDTIIIDNKVNLKLLTFLYQAHSANKKIYILSKHTGDIFEDMKKYKICCELFEQVIVISDDEEKYDYIKEKKSIFIDDSYAERVKVSRRIDIPVFDVDMIESLIDWSC